MIKAPLPIVQVTALSLALALVASCGGNKESGGCTTPPAPTGSTITVNPPEVLWEVGAGACTNTVMQDSFFTITVRNPSGVALTGVGISATLVLAPGTFVPPPQVMYLFDDLDGDGRYTDPITAFPHCAQTGGAGTKTLMVRYDLGGCEFGGNLDVFSGTAYDFARISATVP